jgi:hypothetical protein
MHIAGTVAFSLAMLTTLPAPVSGTLAAPASVHILIQAPLFLAHRLHTVLHLGTKPLTILWWHFPNLGPHLYHVIGAECGVIFSDAHTRYAQRHNQASSNPL